METVLAASRTIDRVLSGIASAAGWLFCALTAVVVVDVVTRRFGYQIPHLGSTRLQELEGHLHAALFAFWLGFAYIRNAHVRIDVAVSGANARTRALLELAGCVVFALPYSLLALYFSALYSWNSFIQGEASVSLSGLPHLYIPKTALTAGLLLLALAVVSVMLRTLVFLYGPAELRAQAGFANYRMRPET